MPTLLQINITANWGSTGKIAESIGIAAMNHGWESYIAYGRWCNPSQSHLIKIGRRFDKYFHYAEQFIRDNEGLCSRKATNKLIRQIEEIKPDVVQLHNIHDHYLNYKILFDYLNQNDIIVVWTFHDCWAFTGHCFHFVSVNCTKWQTECGKCPKGNKFIDHSTSNYNLKKRLFSTNKNLTIVPCSYWMGDFVRESFFKNKRIAIIQNGVDLKVFKPIQEAKRNDGKIRIIAVSNVWLPYKGLDDIFMLRKILSDDYEIIMVGLSEKQMKTLPVGIRGIRRTQNVRELVALYNEADVLINPTYADTFPTVNIESLACGTPVITYKTGGSPEAVTPETGWVVEQGDLEGAAKIIRSMALKNDNELKAQRLACRERAVADFDKERCFEKYIELYGELTQ